MGIVQYVGVHSLRLQGRTKTSGAKSEPGSVVDGALGGGGKSVQADTVPIWATQRGETIRRA